MHGAGSSRIQYAHTPFKGAQEGFSRCTPTPFSMDILWHVTTDCTNHCRHCFVHDERSFLKESRKNPPLERMLRILDQLTRFESEYGPSISRIVLTGGDPILYPHWASLVKEIRVRGKEPHMIGNPETLNSSNIKRLRDAGITYFLMSLDGMPENHDRVRGPGSFSRTMDAIGRLSAQNISVGILFALFPFNMQDAVPLMGTVARNTEADSFSIYAGCAVGNGANLETCMEPTALRQTLTEYRLEKKRLAAEKNTTTIVERMNLLRVAAFSQEDYFPVWNPHGATVSGCSAGWNQLIILTDGSVLSCPKIPVILGRLPERPLEEIILDHPLMRRLRRKSSYAECGSCDFYQVCRGCPAHVFGLTGDPFAANPSCFRNQIDRKVPIPSESFQEPSLNCSRDEELDLIASRSSAHFRERITSLLQGSDAMEAVISLNRNQQERKRFLQDPFGWRRKLRVTLSDDDLCTLMHSFSPSVREPLSKQWLSTEISRKTIWHVNALMDATFSP